MKCPKCGFVSFDFLIACKRCGFSLAGDGDKEKKSIFSKFRSNATKEKSTETDLDEQSVIETSVRDYDSSTKKSPKEVLHQLKEEEQALKDKEFDDRFNSLFGEDKHAVKESNDDTIKITVVDRVSESQKASVDKMDNLRFDDSFFKVTNAPEEEAKELFEEGDKTGVEDDLFKKEEDEDKLPDIDMSMEFFEEEDNLLISEKEKYTKKKEEEITDSEDPVRAADESISDYDLDEQEQSEDVDTTETEAGPGAYILEFDEDADDFIDYEDDEKKN